MLTWLMCEFSRTTARELRRQVTSSPTTAWPMNILTDDQNYHEWRWIPRRKRHPEGGTGAILLGACLRWYHAAETD